MSDYASHSTGPRGGERRRLLEESKRVPLYVSAYLVLASVPFLLYVDS